jgi:hypothetical protein
LNFRRRPADFLCPPRPAAVSFIEVKPHITKSTVKVSEIAVKVLDIFGNDTMTIVDVNVGKSGGRR